MRKQMKGYGWYVIILLIVIATFYISNNIELKNKDEYSYTNFAKDLENGQVVSVDIYPNEEVPTGEVAVTTKDGDSKSFNVLDTVKIDSMASEAGINSVTHEISKPSWFLTSVLPYILVFIIIIVLFSFPFESGIRRRR